MCVDHNQLITCNTTYAIHEVVLDTLIPSRWLCNVISVQGEALPICSRVGKIGAPSDHHCISRPVNPYRALYRCDIYMYL